MPAPPARTESPSALEMVWVPPGTFLMGSPFNEEDRRGYEGPQTQVTIRHGFWLAKYEVTQRQYETVMKNNPSSFKHGPDYPVESVTWHQAARYCARLTEQEQAAGRLPAGYLYRLPTEAEWEYAARAGTTSRFSYGQDQDYFGLNAYAWVNHNDRSQNRQSVAFRGLMSKDLSHTTHPVGTRQPNPWGLYDLYGNVEEWCWDGWRGSLPGGKVVNPNGPANRQYRVVRGGSWSSKAKDCRSASRDFAWPDYRNKGTTGFRPALGVQLVKSTGP